jgi:putative ABC transport system permease protein
MNLYNKLSLAWSYFVKHIRRFAFLLVALGLGFGVITIMTSLSQGMTKNLYSAALNHYGGELFIIGYDQDHRNRMHMNQIPKIEAILEQWDYPMVQLIPRINYFGDGKLYFAGNSSMQKNVLGINWQDEAFNLNDLNILEGSLEDIREPQSIVISSQTAQQLKCRLGDDIILRVDTLQGQANTGHFIVRAIFKDPGLLGSYKSFIDLGEFQGLLNYGPEDISSLGIRFKKPPEVEELFKLYQILQEALPMAPFMETKEQLTHNIERQSWSGIRYFLIPLSLYVSQVDDLLKSMDILAYFLYLMISLIILVSIAVTYRLVIKERTPEIGTMRALQHYSGI